MSLSFSVGSSRGLCVNDLVSVRRDFWRRVVYDDISADGAKRGVRVKADTISNKVSAVLETLDFVDHTLISELGV